MPLQRSIHFLNGHIPAAQTDSDDKTQIDHPTPNILYRQYFVCDMCDGILSENESVPGFSTFAALCRVYYMCAEDGERSEEEECSVGCRGGGARGRAV